MAHIFLIAVYAAAGYWLCVYVLLPQMWRHYEHNPGMEAAPKICVTVEGLPGDPLNVGMVATADALAGAIEQAGWTAADPLGVRASMKIAKSVLLKQSYPNAPMSNYYLFGRPQDLAFQKEVGGSPRSRHHVRFWEAPIADREGRSLWLGSATFDLSVGVSRATGKFTHHIDPDIDRERDMLFSDLKRAGQLSKLYQVTGVGATLTGRNGSLDWFFTDGEMTVGVIGPEEVRVAAVEMEPNPAHIAFKNAVWSFFRGLLQPGEKAARS